MQDYDVIREIGSGSFGKVCKVRRKTDSRELACKEVNYRNLTDKEKGQIVAEVNILKELQNPFIVRYYEHIIESRASRLHIIMELCSGGDLSKAIQKCQKDNSTINEDVIWKIFAQVASALKDCHRHMEGSTVKPILHRDIKPANIFLDSHNNIKIGDFGLAKELSSEKTNTQTNVGTPFYMSPELINGKSYDERSDIWSLGCLLYELACLKPPHHDARGTKDLVTKINSGRVRRIPHEYSNDLWKTIQELMAVDLSRRPRIEEVLDIRVPAFVRHMAVVRNTINEYNATIAMERKYKEKEDELRAREGAVAAKEKAVAAKEAEVSKKEQQLLVKEAHLRQQELDIKKEREKATNATTTGNSTAAPASTVNAKTTTSSNAAAPSATTSSTTTGQHHTHALRKPPSALLVAKPSSTAGFQIYADPPSSSSAATTGANNTTNSKNLPPPPPPPPMATRTTDYMVAAEGGSTARSSTVTASTTTSAINRRRSLTAADAPSTATSAANTANGNVKEVSDGVRRAKELLSQHGKQQQGAAGPGVGKENSTTASAAAHHGTYVSKPLCPPPPPPSSSNAAPTTTATATITATRKRTIGATLSAAPINAANMANIMINNHNHGTTKNGSNHESPLKKMRPTNHGTGGPSLQLRVAPPPPTTAAAGAHAMYAAQQKHLAPSSRNTNASSNVLHNQMKEATALL